MRPLPKKATGTHPLVDVINQLIDCVRERTPLLGNNHKVDYLNNGFRIHHEESTRSVSEMLEFRGEYDSTEQYEVDDILIYGGNGNASALAAIAAGTKAGTYRVKKRPLIGTEPDQETIDAGTNQYYETFSRGSWKKLVIKSGSFSITLDGTDNGSLVATNGIVKFEVKPEEKSIRLSNADSSGASVLLDLDDAEGKEIKLRKVDVCDDDGETIKQAIALMSEPF